MSPCLLYTDILSELLKQRDPRVAERAAAYFAVHGQFDFSGLTRYKVLPGLKDKGAVKQVERFEALCQRPLVLPITDSVLVLAADLWVLGRAQGQPRSDADLILAATAIEQKTPLVTGNTTISRGFGILGRLASRVMFICLSQSTQVEDDAGGSEGVAGDGGAQAGTTGQPDILLRDTCGARTSVLQPPRLAGWRGVLQTGVENSTTGASGELDR